MTSTETVGIPSIDTLLGSPYMDGLSEEFDEMVMGRQGGMSPLAHACNEMLLRDKTYSQLGYTKVEKLARRMAYIIEGSYEAGQVAGSDPRLLMGMDGGGSTLPTGPVDRLFQEPSAANDCAWSWSPTPDGLDANHEFRSAHQRGNNPLFMEPQSSPESDTNDGDVTSGGIEG